MKNIRPFLLASLLLSGTAMAQQHITLSGYTGQTEIKATGSVTLADGFQVPYGSSVRIFTGASFQLCNPLASSPSANQNYVLSRVFRVAGVSSANINAPRSVCEENQTIQYIDGLGRPLQTVTVQGSPSFADMVQPMAYDALGREAVKYQPYSVANNNGAYRPGAVAEQLGFYAGQPVGSSIRQTSQPFSQTVFEASPLNRVLEQGAPGAPWQPYSASIAGSGHTAKPGYAINDATDAVKLWTVSASGAATTANYQPGTLYKTVSKDENWTSGRAGTTEEFKDLEGRVVLKRVWETESVSLSTQYLYDDMGSLCYVLPPAVTASSFTEADAVFGNYIYGYHYDGRKRIIEKKIPGKGWEHLVYNKLDQVVMTQGANQRVQNQWLFTKYDALGRTIITGLLGSTSTRAMWQTAMDGQTVLWETRDDANAGGTGTGYTNATLPNAGISSCLTINYYDDYGFYGNSFDAPTGEQATGGRTRGLATGTKTNMPSTGAMLLTVSYYDEEGRAVQTRSGNHLGGTDIVDNSYSFVGELVASTRTHTSSPGGTPTTIAIRYEYDHMGRKLATMEEINGQGEVVLARLDYNELGQLRQKNLHSTDGASFLQHTKFAYNERGWLKNSVSDEFSMELKYEDGTAPQFNGNISGQLWGAGGTLPNVFAYGYDKLNRLVEGKTTAGVAMGETLAYDAMGNIASLSRFDGSVTKTGTYSYAGNQLTGITGGALATGAYTYDGNGNATTDGRNGVALAYNYLNLPVSAAKSGLSLSYVYDAMGTKLKKVNNLAGTTTDYVGGIQYVNGTIDFIQTEEGLARSSGGSYSYEYNLTDHLGNVRYTFNRHPATGQLQPLQADDYYAFGMRRVASPGNNKYLYNGKELQEELEVYDYGARFYDPVIGRWNVVDPLAEGYHSFSPFNYVENNPISNIDPDGRSTEGLYTRYLDTEGRTIINTNDGRDDVYVVPDNRLEEFKENVRASSGRLQQGRTDSQGWNNYWRDEFQQVMSESEVNKAGINSLSDEKVKAAAFEYIFGNRSYESFVWEEVKAQWRNPGTVAMGLTAFGHGLVGAIDALQNTKPVYDPRVRARGVEDPTSHNFPYSFDEAILKTKPILKNNGYRIYQKQGTMNGKPGVYEIGVNSQGVIDHRFFRPTKN
ncbi:DUF6443 domain-containing protein [Pedobacter sp. KR3-3]|uniref:DUF6443 domain-containing protein n=1 Tax=Pedobacter albus TaxID=3113905 RepID=A0ABU7I941_9SPHI|nr:DUF6443 domain-containing protein [Pedobacter sp. KR3-3]MEE1945904.1 DUF6443 domain-containing protein [Pedobacter sp. KR3-3]